MAMSWAKFSEAKKKMIRRAAMILVEYEVVFCAVMWWVDKNKPSDTALLLLAALPTVTVAAFIFNLGRYLREERDEFHRELVVRCLLWGLAAVMLVVAFHGFLQLYGWKGNWPVAIDIGAFVVAMGAAKLTYKVANRVPADA
jgi:hypothetical protein